MEVSLQFTSFENFASDVITRNLFGTSFENREQTVDAGSPFTTVISQLPVKLLRFPGGSQTEAYFDPANPENVRPQSIFATSSFTTFEPISEFISYVTTNGIRPVFVIPTFRYFDKNSPENGYLSDSAVLEINNFVKQLLSGNFGNVNVAAFEIGNEWFSERMLYNADFNPSGWTAAEFGVLQGKIASIVQEAIDEISPNASPDIWVQSSQNGDTDVDGNGVRDNLEILAGLDSETILDIDGVIEHFYQPTRGDTPLEAFSLNWVPSTRIGRLIEDGWHVEGFDALDIVASEWNVRAARNGALFGDSANITGFERLPLFLGLFADMVSCGVDVAMVYTAQALGLDGGSGTLSQKGDTTLTPTGLLFQMMGNSIVGTRLLDPSSNSTDGDFPSVFQDASGADVGICLAFAGSGKVVVYLSSAVNSISEVLLGGFGALFDQGYTMSGTMLTVAEGSNPVDSEVDGVVLPISSVSLDGNILGDGVLEFTLRPFEVIQIVFTRTNGVYLLADRNLQQDDSMQGTDLNDTLIGYAGNDTLHGLDGTDLLEGGDGNDHVLGEEGDDTLNGGFGNDSVRGGSGNDLLTGGSGVDNLIGGQGNDLLVGGIEADSLYGGEGDDSLDGGIGGDHLWGGRGADRHIGGDGVQYARYDDANYGDLMIRLDGFANVGLAAAGDTYIFIEGLVGGSGNDTVVGNSEKNFLFGSGGKDLVFGGGGDDFLFGDTDGDHLWGGVGYDQLHGGTGSGVDYARYDDANHGNLMIRLDGVANSGAAAIGDTYIEIEGLVGGVGNDSVVGNAANNYLFGSGGADLVFGGDGNDYLAGDVGADNLWGGAGADSHYGGSDARIDYARYDDANYGKLTIRLDAPAGNTGAAAGDTYFGIEGLVGGAGSDLIVGDASANYLFGSGGNDNIFGLDGSDYLNGGAGADHFHFSTAPRVANKDTIADFAVGVDVICLTQAIFAAIGASLTVDEFRIGAAVDSNDFILFDSVTGALTYDSNGSTAGGATQFATLTAGLALTVADFIIV